MRDDQAHIARIVVYLHADWAQLFRLTTIAQAMQSLGMCEDTSLRLRVGAYLAQQTPLHSPVARWGICTFILTEDEKLLGRYLTDRANGLAGAIAVRELAQALGCSSAVVLQSLTVLGTLKLVTWQLHAGLIDYALVPEWETVLGPLGWMFHTVQTATGNRFNVPCAFDVLLLAGSELAHERIDLWDACAHCTDRLHVVIEGRRVLQVEPPDAVVFRGGG
ncbi:MAG: hypothetical protein NVS2B7_17890 [Herpetosiphon sp.]